MTHLLIPPQRCHPQVHTTAQTEWQSLSLQGRPARLLADRAELHQHSGGGFQAGVQGVPPGVPRLLSSPGVSDGVWLPLAPRVCSGLHGPPLVSVCLGGLTRARQPLGLLLFLANATGPQVSRACQSLEGFHIFPPSIYFTSLQPALFSPMGVGRTHLHSFVQKEPLQHMNVCLSPDFNLLSSL